MSQMSSERGLYICVIISYKDESKNGTDQVLNMHIMWHVKRNSTYYTASHAWH